MSTTVGELLELSIFQQNSKLLSSEGLSRKVQYVTIMEAPDFHVEQMGDYIFILTTLSSHCENLQTVNLIVERLCQAEVAAIAIKLGRFINEIDLTTIAIAKKYKIPLMTFNVNVQFREVLADSLALISDKQRLIINQINEMNRQAFESILENCSPRKIIRLLCDKIKCYGCCLDTSGKVIAKVSSLDQSVDQICLEDKIDSFYHQQKNDGNWHYVLDENVVIFPCSAQNGLTGIFIVVFDAENRSELILPLCEAVVNALNVKFLERNLKMQAEREMMSAILDDVLFVEHTDEEMIIDRLSLLNFKPQKYHMIIVIKWHDETILDYNSGHTFDIIQGTFEQRIESVLFFNKGNRYIGLLSYSSVKDYYALSRLMKSCNEIISQATNRRIDIGCCLPVTNFLQMPECFKQAKQAIMYGKKFYPEKGVYLYDDYFDMGLIAMGINSDASAIFFQKIILPIKEHDQKYDSELWPTLECCFLQSTLDKAADSMFIHISTLRYRLKKIESLTGFNYFDTKDRMKLYMACQLLNVTSIQE